MARLGFAWSCHICNRERPDTVILVYRTDISGEHGLPAGTMWQNVRFCRDNPDCAEKAQTFRFMKPKKPEGPTQ